MLQEPIRILLAFLVSVTVFTGIRIVGFRSFPQPSSVPAYPYFSFNVWMLPVAILFLGWYVADTVWGARAEIARLREEGVSAGRLFLSFLIPLLLFALAVTVVANNVFRLYAVYIYRAYGAFLMGLKKGVLPTDGGFENFFNYETFSVTLTVPVAAVALVLAAVFFLVLPKCKGARGQRVNLNVFGMVGTGLLSVMAFYDLFNMFASPEIFPDGGTPFDFSFAPYLTVLAVLVMIGFAVCTVRGMRGKIREMQAEGVPSAKIYLKVLALLLFLALAVSCLSLAGHVWYLFMNHKLESFQMLVGSGSQSVVMSTVSFPPYVPNVATWLTGLFVPAAVLALAGAATLFILLRRQNEQGGTSF